ncbi:MAG: preprotein translocase subunit SecG [Rhodospirillaceae bacterium]|jgi:preprotein translocase subunit SecG|nr:preprotein translocase subunit SecG [Rhodospirillaceae bacterium]
MVNTLLIIHLLIAIILVGVILLQRSEGGALGIGGNSIITGRAAGNLLTRATAILAVGFFVTNLALALVAKIHNQPNSIMDNLSIKTSSDPIGSTTPKVPLSH